MSEKKPVYEFPCDYPIKVFGMVSETFEKAVLDVIEKHAKVDPKKVQKKLSRNDKYVSLTVVIFAESQKIVESIYKGLKKNKDILMVL